MKKCHQLKCFDIYGETLNFSINKKDKFQTAAGGALTIFIYIFSIIILIFNLREYISRDNPLTYSTEYISNVLNVTGRDYIFAIWLSKDDSKNPYIKEEFKKLFDLKLEYFDKWKLKKTFDFKICNNSQYNKEIDDQIFPNHTFCPDIPEEEEFSLTPFGNYLKLNVKFTNAKAEEYKKFIGEHLKSSETFFTFVFNKVLYNALNYTHPLNGEMVDFYSINNLNTRKSIYIKLKQMIVETEVFDLFGIYEKHEAVGISSVDKDFSMIEDIIPGKNFATVFFDLSYTHTKYIRKYLEFFKVFSESALESIFMFLIIKYFYSFYWTFRYKNYLFRKLTVRDKGANNKEYIEDNKDLPRNFLIDEEICKNFYQKNTLEKNILLGIKKESQYANVDQNFLKRIDSENLEIRVPELLKRQYITIGNQNPLNPTIKINNPYIEKAHDRLTLSKEKNIYSYCSYICYRRLKGNNYNAIKEFSKIFKQKLDVFFYFEKLKEIDLIKKFLFDKSQLKLIDLISKKHPFSLNIANQNAMNFKTEKLITKEELKELMTSIDFLDKLNKDILEEMFQFTENLKK